MQALFLAVSKKTQGRKNSRFQKNSSKFCQKLKDRPTLTKEYFLIVGKFSEKMQKWNHLLSYLVQNINFVMKNVKISWLWVQDLRLHTKILKKNLKTQGKSQKNSRKPQKTHANKTKTQESANSSWDWLAKFGQKKAWFKAAEIEIEIWGLSLALMARALR